MGGQAQSAGTRAVGGGVYRVAEEACGFENVEARRIPDDTPTPDDYQTKSFHSLEDLRAFKRIGALLLMASKPDVRTRAPGHAIY